MPTVLVYSEDPVVRDQVRTAIGRSPAPGVDLDYLDAETHAEVIAAVDRRAVQLLVLDGEAWPTGGMGIARELKNTYADCPPIVVLIARRDDRWLAKWSQADATVMYPIDPVELTDTVVIRLGAKPYVLADKETS